MHDDPTRLGMRLLIPDCKMACLTYFLYSARTGIGLAIGSFGALGAAPSQGALLTGAFLWHKPIIFSGVSLILKTSKSLR